MVVEDIEMGSGMACGGCAELDALEADMGGESEETGMPSYLQEDAAPESETDLHLPAAPQGHQAMPQRVPVSSSDNR